MKFVNQMRSLFLDLKLRAETDPQTLGSGQFHTHASYPPSGACHQVGPVMSTNRP